MTETFPELYTPEKPYVNNNGETKHVMKLIGSLYEPRKAELPTESSDEDEAMVYTTKVLTDE